jgi:hypothetical protein
VLREFFSALAGDFDETGHEHIQVTGKRSK